MPINFKSTVLACGTRGFNEALAGDIADHKYQLPLQRFCKRGGNPYADDLEHRVVSSTTENNKLILLITFYFDEETAEGCRDATHKDPATGNLEFNIDLVSGNVSFEPEDHFK